MISFWRAAVIHGSLVHGVAASVLIAGGLYVVRVDTAEIVDRAPIAPAIAAVRKDAAAQVATVRQESEDRIEAAQAALREVRKEAETAKKEAEDQLASARREADQLQKQLAAAQEGCRRIPMP
jgi:vacuolar-type H+-ATPase subunit H